MKRTILVLLLLFCRAAYSDATPVYQAALKYYQDKNYAEAEKKFEEFLKLEADNLFGLYNLGLSAFNNNKRGYAVAAWRRVLSVDPDFSPALKALSYAETQMPSDVFSTQNSTWESLRKNVLSLAHLDRFFGLTVLLLLFSSFLGVRYYGARHRAFRDEKPLPPFPTVLIFFVALLLLSSAATVAKTIADTEARATVISKDLSVRSGPSSDDNILFDLIEGSEVILVREVEQWAQISYPGGLSGWVPSNSLLKTSGL